MSPRNSIWETWWLHVLTEARAAVVGAKGHQLRGARATSVYPSDLYRTKQHLKQQQAFIIHFMYVNDILVSCVMVQKLDNLSLPYWEGVFLVLLCICLFYDAYLNSPREIV